MQIQSHSQSHIVTVMQAQSCSQSHGYSHMATVTIMQLLSRIHMVKQRKPHGTDVLYLHTLPQLAHLPTEMDHNSQ